jgi:hypothetical protein
MKELSKQINNAEARFQVLEVQMNQNVKDHETILGEVRHNCKENKGRFDSIEGKVDSIVEAMKHAIECKADKDEFLYWRNLLVSGIILAVGLMLLENFLR